MQLENMIWHELVKAQHSDVITVKPRDEELMLPDANADRLVTDASSSYRKDTGVAYATFLKDGWFPDNLRALVDSKITFEQFSTTGLSQLRDLLKSTPPASGGYLFFIKYSDANVSYMLVLLLKDIEGLIIDGEELSKSHILNLDKLHFAARVNINNWLASKGRYITFLKGRSRSEISSYFKVFLCIDDSSFDDPKRNTKSIVQSIIEYCNGHVETEDQRHVIRSRLAQTLKQSAEDKRPVTVQEVAALVNPEEPEKFIHHLRSSEYEVQNEFQVDKVWAKRLVRYVARTPTYTLSFDHAAIDRKSIQLHHDEDNVPYLKISQLPDDIVRQLRQFENESEQQD